MRKAIVIGTGGHCRVILSLVSAIGEHEIVGILDLVDHRQGEVILGIPVTGSVLNLNDMPAANTCDVFLAIGDNKLRKHWWHKMMDLGYGLPNLVSPHAIVDSHAELGVSNVICAKSYIGPDATVGNNNLINTGAVLEHEARLGSHVHLSPLSVVAGRTSLGDECMVGAGATVIDELSVAAGSIVGAGATVVRDIVNEGGIYLGTPAKRQEE